MEWFWSNTITYIQYCTHTRAKPYHEVSLCNEKWSVRFLWYMRPWVLVHCGKRIKISKSLTVPHWGTVYKYGCSTWMIDIEMTLNLVASTTSNQHYELADELIKLMVKTCTYVRNLYVNKGVRYRHADTLIASLQHLLIISSIIDNHWLTLPTKWWKNLGPNWTCSKWLT